MIINHKSPAKSQRINEQRSRLISNGFVWGGRIYDIEGNSLLLIMSRALSLTIDPSIMSVDWRTKDNRIVPFGRDEFQKFATAADSYIESILKKSWGDKDAIT